LRPALDINSIYDKLLSRDEKTLEMVYEHYYNQVMYICYKICRNKEDAKEAAQDTFFKAFKNLEQLKEVDKFGAWLKLIATRECYAVGRKSLSKIDDSGELTNDQVRELDEDFLPEEYIKKQELRTELLKVIDELPQKQREVIYMYYYSDMDSTEIAALHKSNPGSVRKLLYDARNSIKNKIEKSKSYAFLSSVSVVPLLLLFRADEESVIREIGYIAMSFVSLIGGGVAAASASGQAAATASAAAGASSAGVATGTIVGIACAAVVAVSVAATLYFTNRGDDTAQPETVAIHETFETEDTEEDIITEAIEIDEVYTETNEEIAEEIDDDAVVLIPSQPATSLEISDEIVQDTEVLVDTTLEDIQDEATQTEIVETNNTVTTVTQTETPPPDQVNLLQNTTDNRTEENEQVVEAPPMPPETQEPPGGGVGNGRVIHTVSDMIGENDALILENNGSRVAVENLLERHGFMFLRQARRTTGEEYRLYGIREQDKILVIGIRHSTGEWLSKHIFMHESERIPTAEELLIWLDS